MKLSKNNSLPQFFHSIYDINISHRNGEIKHDVVLVLVPRVKAAHDESHVAVRLYVHSQLTSTSHCCFLAAPTPSPSLRLMLPACLLAWLLLATPTTYAAILPNLTPTSPEHPPPSLSIYFLRWSLLSYFHSSVLCFFLYT